MLRIAEAVMAYIVRFASPSARRRPYATLLKSRKIVAAKTISPYSTARPVAPPAPMAEIRVSRNGTRRMVRRMERAAVRISACIAALSAPFLFLAPIHREIAELAPAPRPLPRPMRIMKNGVMNPTAARASSPRPATQMASARL